MLQMELQYKYMQTHSIGKTLMLRQETEHHNKKLYEIYHHQSSKGFSFNQNTTSLVRLPSKTTTLQSTKHVENIKRLYHNLNQQKSMRNRYKEANDFYAFPVYFFRQISNTPFRKSSNFKTNKKGNTYKSVKKVVYTNKKGKISDSQIRKHLPFLTKFESEDLQEFADALTKIILQYDIFDSASLQILQDKVMTNIPEHYPQEFVDAIHQMLWKIREQVKK